MRRLKQVLQIIPWLLACLAIKVLLWNAEIVKESLRNTQFLERLTQEDVSPRRAILEAYYVAENCATATVETKHQLSSDQSSDQRPATLFEGDSEPINSRYDLFYHRRMDRSSFSWKAYPPRIKNTVGSSLTMPAIGAGLTAQRFPGCWSTGISKALKTAEWRGFDPRILWIYSYLELDKTKIFVSWPGGTIPKGFDPSQRPWFFDNIAKGHARSERLGSLEILSTRPYRDAFSKETIVTLVVPSSLVGGGRVLAAVDLRVGAKPGTYALILLLNFGVVLASSVGSALLIRTFDLNFFKAWHRSWLALVAIYSLFVLEYFAQGSSPMLEKLRLQMPLFVDLLSLISNAFLMLAACLLIRPGRPKISRLAALLVASFFGLTIISSKILNIGIGSLSLAEIADGVFSFLALSLLGLALIIVCWRCGRKDSRVLAWAKPCSGLVGFFFLLYAGIQLTIPFWDSQPALEDAFWVMSVFMKISTVALFYAVMLIDLYCGKVEVNSIFVEKLRHGIIAVDGDFKIVNINEYAAEEINLSPADVNGRSLTEVLFRSWFAAEGLYAKLTKEGEVIDYLMNTKCYSDRNPQEYGEVARKISAWLIGGRGDREREQTLALFFLQQAGGDEEGTEGVPNSLTAQSS